MDLRTSFPFWLIKDGSIRDYNSLSEDIRTGIVILGGGITGALVAYHLLRAGMSVTVIDKRHIGTGSTAATTGLLQYEIDEPLHQLALKVGYERANAAYRSCYQALDSFERIVTEEEFNCGFTTKPSFQFASFKKDINELEEEFRWRKKIGIDLEWVDRAFIRDHYGFDSGGGLLSYKAAEVDAYALTQQIFARYHNHGLSVFHNTTVTDIGYTSTGVSLKTDQGHRIKASKLVIACGYESGKFIPKKIEDLHSTYVTISEPFDGNREHWYRDSLIWETARPYLYIRTTPGNRILVGGKDDDFYDPVERSRRAPLKAAQLCRSFAKLFPSIAFRTDYYWAGAFGVTKDSLPFIGSIPSRPHTFFALGFGGNGIIYSVIAAEIIRDAINGKKYEFGEWFSFER